jgi:SAM-dependent methyltransferase
MRELFQRWRHESDDPEPFYSMLAAEVTFTLEQRHGALAGTTIADLGSGPGYYARTFRSRAAFVIPIDGALEELDVNGAAPPGSVVANAGRLPLVDASVDAVFCSNMLEHTPDPQAVVLEIERVLRPGGWCYLSWTNWYSPWGGHAMTPYQFLGPRLGPRLYERLHGLPRKHRYGEGLFAVHIGRTLRDVRDRSALRIERVEPRYWPWASFIARIPGAREVLCWNCVIHFVKTDIENDGHRFHESARPE